MKTNRVTLRLAAAFGVLIVLLVTVGCWGVDHLAKMNRSVQVIVNQRWQMVQLSREALRYSALNSRITMQIFLLPDKTEIEPLLDQRAKNSDEISELLKTIEAGLESDVEKSLVTNIWTNRIPYVNSYQLALNLLLKEEQPEAGRQMMSGVVLNNLIAYHKAWETFVEYQSGQMDQAGQAAEARYAAARQELIMLVVMATLLAAAIALFVIRNLIREITERTRAEETLRESEERFSGAFAHAPIGVALVAPDGHWLKVNQALCDLIGYSEAELLTRTFQDITHPEDLEVDLENVRRMLAGEIRTYHLEKRYVHVRGHFVSILLSVSLVRDGQSQPRYFIAQIQDISERKRAETALRESEERTRLLVKAANIGLWDWNLLTNDVFFSVEWKSQLGYTDAELPSRLAEWESRLHPEDRAPTLAAVKDYLEGRRADYEVEFRLRHKDGSWRCFLTRANLTRDSSGQAVRIMGCHIDITERKRSEAALEKAHQELVKASRQAGIAEITTGVLHNVGNVLNSVNVASSCMADSIKKSKAANLSKVVALLREHETDLGVFLTTDPKGKQVPGYLAQLAEHLAGEQAGVLKELAQLQKNIEHIKEVVSAQQSCAKGSGKSETLQVTDLVEDTLRMDLCSGAHHDIQVIRQFEQAPAITVDKHKVLQILMNLVRNAKQACHEWGSLEKRLTLRVTNGGDRVRIAVSDNGVGIAPENLARIFAHGFTTKKDGHGFGLHSGALAAKEMGGSLHVHSDGVGQGAIFTLELPLQTSPHRS